MPSEWYPRLHEVKFDNPRSRNGNYRNKAKCLAAEYNINSHAFSIALGLIEVAGEMEPFPAGKRRGTHSIQCIDLMLNYPPL